MLPLAALAVLALPALVAARARHIRTITKPQQLDTNNSSIVWITASPGDQVRFEPPNANATVGQIVNFIFPDNLPVSVTQSTVQAPCTYLNTSTEQGFDSQLQQSVIYSLEVMDNEPIYFHCKHPGHCGQGMVGTINAPTSGNATFSVFQGSALKLGSNAPTETNGSAPIAGSAADASIIFSVAPAPSSTPAAGTTNDAQIRARMWPAGAILVVAVSMLLC